MKIMVRRVPVWHMGPIDKITLWEALQEIKKHYTTEQSLKHMERLIAGETIIVNLGERQSDMTYFTIDDPLEVEGGV
jgi:hypothetical protein